MFFRKTKQRNFLNKVDHYAAYTLFTFSVVVYFWLSRNALLYLLDEDQTDANLPVFAFALGVCWLGSVIVMGGRLRFYLKNAPGWRSYVAALVPLLIVPAVWALLEVFRLVEV